jgi:hypothetical protein
MRLTYTYSWRLRAGGEADARRIVGRLRERAVELGLGPVGEVIEASGHDGEEIPGRRVWTEFGEVELSPVKVISFTAVPPGDRPARFGLGLYPAAVLRGGEYVDVDEWVWGGAVATADQRRVGLLMQTAAEVGLDVAEAFGGMVFASRRGPDGRVRTEQRPAFDPELF